MSTQVMATRVDGSLIPTRYELQRQGDREPRLQLTPDEASQLVLDLLGLLGDTVLSYRTGQS